MKNCLKLCAITIAILSTPSYAVTYSIVDLGTLGGFYSGGRAVNDAGQVTGYGGNTYGTTDAFLYTNGAMTNLGQNYVGFSGLTIDGSIGLSINNSGHVVGSTQITTDEGVSTSRATYWANGVGTDMGTLGGLYSHAASINNSGQVVGAASIANGQQRAFLYSNGSMQDLGNLGGTYSNARSINDSGVIVGVADLANTEQHMFIYNNGVMQDTGYAYAAPSAINNNNQIVGYTSYNAFIYENGVLTNLNIAGLNQAYGINNQGQIVGWYDESGGSAFLYENGVASNLNDLIDPNSGWLLSVALGINNFGWITGVGTHNGQQRAFLAYLDNTSAVPVPAALPLMLSGLGVLGVAARRRKNEG